MSGSSLVFSPSLPWWLIGLLAAAVVAVVVLGLLSRASGTIPRAVVGVLLVLALSGPILNDEQREPVKDVALIVVDETPSQQIAGRDETARQAGDTIEERLRRFDDTLEVRRIVVRHDAISDAADGTRIFDAARQALGDVPARRYAGTVLITDGDIHDPDRASSLPEGPLHTILTGDRDTVDRRLTVLEAPGFGLVGEPVTIKIRIDDIGLPADAPSAQTVRVRVRLDDVAIRGPRVAVGEETTFTITPTHRGANIVELGVPALEGEVSDSNNRALISINGVRDRLKVLLVSGEPHPGERTWRNLLKSDPSVDLVHFTILRPPEKQDGTPIQELSLIAFPTRELFEVKLDEFDLIVFDRYRRRGVLPSIYLSNVVEYVRNGGALLEAVGPDFASPYSLFRTPLGELIPSEPTGAVIEEGYVPTVSDIGSRHPVTARLSTAAIGKPADVPGWGRWFRIVEATQRSGDAVMTGAGGRPLLILDRAAQGRVAQLTSDHIWLWARGFEGGGPHAELLRRLAHWLMKEPELEEEVLRARLEGNRLAVERRTLNSPEQIAVTVESPDGETTSLLLKQGVPGLYGASLPVSQAGLYRITDGDRTALATVGALNPLELSSFVPKEDSLAPLVAERDGLISWLTDDGLPGIRRSRPEGAASGSDWMGFRANGDYVVTGLRSTPLLPPWLVALIAILLIALVWRLETDR